jgi:hypothetical protein
LVHVFDNLNWSGDHASSFDAANELALSESLDIRTGIGIIAEVEFGTLPLSTPGISNSILFSTAGVRFVTAQRLIATIIHWLASLFEGPQPDRQ